MVQPEVFYPVLGYVRVQLIVNSVIVFLVLLVVSLRVTGRLMGPGLGWDDGFVILAVSMGVAMLVCQGLFAPIGNGYPLTEYPDLVANIPYILKLTFGMQLIYVTLFAAVKATGLQTTLVFVAMWIVGYLASFVSPCRSISGQWTGEGTCGDYIPMIQFLIATNAIGDLIIMALPMHSIWMLILRKADKLGIMACFALGLACVVCAVFRLVHISTAELEANVTGTMLTTILLFILEPNLAILCVSIPMLQPFYTIHKKRMGGSKLQESDEGTSGYKDQSDLRAPSS